MNISLGKIGEVLMIFFSGILLFVLPVVMIVEMITGSKQLLEGSLLIIVYLLLGLANGWITAQVARDRPPF